MGLPLLRLVVRGFSKLDVGLDDIARNVSWYGRSPLPGECDVMAAMDLSESLFDRQKLPHTESTRGPQARAQAEGGYCACARV